MTKSIFTIGSDPEVCLVDNNGQLRSAIPFIKGTKNNPEELPNGGSIQYDNVACEFNTPVAKSEGEFIESITGTLKCVKDYLPDNLKFYPCGSVDFPETELEHEEAKRFGCDPDFNAWSCGEPNCAAEGDDRSKGTLRSFGAHVHLGYVEGSGNEFLLEERGAWETIAVMDTLLGVRSVLLDKLPGSARRRELYGKAGAHRTPAHGVEYRVLSNFWIWNDTIMKELYSMCDKALTIVRDRKIKDLFAIAPPRLIVTAINESDDGIAKTLWTGISKFLKTV